MLQSWGVPVAMTGVYAVLAWSSGTSTTGKAWMAIGLAFVFVLWWLFRLLTEHAALSRAVAVGDSARVLELTERQLRKRKKPAARARYLVYRGLAHELRGDWAEALAAVDEARFDGLSGSAKASWQLLAASVRIAALVETGKASEARRALDRELTPAMRSLDRRLHGSAYVFGNLATGRVLAAEGARDEATSALQGVVDDIRAGAGLRATAHHYLARVSDDPAAIARHRAEIAKLVPDPAAWVRTAR
jgi:hypothetical protein